MVVLLVEVDFEVEVVELLEVEDDVVVLLVEVVIE